VLPRLIAYHYSSYVLYFTEGIGQRTGGGLCQSKNHIRPQRNKHCYNKSQRISQYTPEPRIISYAPNASGDVMGKFESQKRVFTFRLSNKGLVYKPLVQRKDSESDQDYAVRVDIGSDILLEQYDRLATQSTIDRQDAAKAFKPKPSVRVPAAKKERGTKEKPNCSAVSYHCGVCISLGKNCIKNANTAVLKERLQKINSLSKMVAKGQAVPQVKTGVIGAKVDPASLKKKVNEFVQKQAGGTKNVSPTQVLSKVTPKQLEVYEKVVGKVLQNDKDGKRKEALLSGNGYHLGDAYLNMNDRDTNGVSLSDLRKNGAAIAKAIVQRDAKTKVPVSSEMKAEIDRMAAPINKVNKLIQGARDAAKVGGGSSDRYIWEMKDKINEGLESAKLATEKLEKARLHGEKNNYDLSWFPSVKVLDLTDKESKELKTSIKDKQASLRAAAEPNKTTTLSTPLPLTAQSQKRLERGESISDFDTYHVKKEGNKFRVTDPNKFEDEGKLVDKAGLAAHMKELESKPSAVKKSSSMNPAIPMSSNPDTMLRALRDGRLIGDAKQGYEIQQRGKDEYLVTTMPNKNGDYSGVMSRKELVDFVKGGGDASAFNKESKANSFLFPKKSGEDLTLSAQLAKGGDFTQKLPTTGEMRKRLEDDYIPLTSGKNLTPSQKKQSRTADQVAIDRTKSDVSNATKRINTLDDSIKKLKAGSGVMSEADLKKVASLERQKGEWAEQKAKHQAKLESLAKVKDTPQTQGTGETEAERRQFLLNTNTEQANKKPEPKREIELADVKTPQEHVKYATQELAIAKASKDPERINKWIDELQRAKKRSMSQAQVSANTYQPDLFFVNKGNPNQKSIFDSDRNDAEYDDSVERNILANIGLMVSRAMTGNQTSPNTVQLRKVKYADNKVSGIFTQYGSQYDFEITDKGVVISPLQVRQDSTVRQDRIAGIAYKKTATIGTNRKCGRGYKCKGSCISKNNKCRVNWATKEGLEQFKSMQKELDGLNTPRFIDVDGNKFFKAKTQEEFEKGLSLAKRLAEAKQSRKEFADESKTKAAKYYKAIGDRVDAKVAEKLKEAGLNVKQVKSTLAELDPKDIAVDPKRFQYKITGEHTASGTVGSLQGVGKWDENLAGILQVWKDPADGKTYVVNGHNRLSKANELGADKVAVRYLDVPSHQEARTIGAMTNIAEGHGTALDAAKFFRDTNWTKEDVIKKGIPLKEKIATDGLAIASLEANLFRQVIDGDLPMERAAIIGGNGLSHEKQKSLMELLDKRKNVNNSVLSELIDTVKNSGQKQEEQFDLFGNSTATVDLAIQRASLQSYIKQKLGSEKKLFGTVSKSKSAKDLERGGNQIDVDQSSKIADEAATALKMFDTVKHNVGGVSDTLNSASERLAAAKTKAERDKISRETYENVLKNIQQEHDKLFKGTKRSDSRQRTDAGDLGSTAFNTQNQILTYITDNSGNMMGICQIGGIKYRFLKPVFGETVLTPVSETNLGYLFDDLKKKSIATAS
jgi:hypothetical protein